MNPNTDETTHLGEIYDRGSLRRAGRQERRMARRSGGSGGSITGGVFLIGLGMLVLTGWWWPGIMLVIGGAAAAELARRGQAPAAIATFACFVAIPLGIASISAIDVPWLPVGAFILIALGLISLARAATRSKGGQA